MVTWPTNPAVYEINSWVWLHDLGREYGRPISLENVPQAELERLAALRFDGIWLMGLWERSPASGRIAQEDARLQMAYRQVLPDWTAEDVIGSPYAIRDYRVDPMLGGDAGLAALRGRLRQLGLLLILDFVPNHLAIDHPWVADHPDRLVQGSPASLEREPNNFFQGAGGDQPRVFAHGRDPSFGGWTDTVQLDYRRPGTRQAMADTLVAIAGRCDGVRCDMAMLVTHDVFLRTWGGEFDPPGAQFWPTAIGAVRARYPDFLMLAEVYWDMEHELQMLGFDYTYDKRLYDRLAHGSATSIRAHLGAGQNDQDRLDNVNYQRHLARFVENHDEQRAVAAFGMQHGLAAAAVALTLPGFRLFHEGQLEGRRLRLPVQLGRRQPEPAEPGVQSFYSRLLAKLADPVFHDGEWQLLEPREAWGENSSYQNFVAYRWILGDEYRLVIVNMAAGRSQCYLPLGFPALAGETWELRDVLSDRKYPRRGEDLQSPGLYLDLDGYDYHLFQFQLRPQADASPHGIELRCTFRGHEQGIYALAWSPDGRLLASGGNERTILVWTAEDGRLVHSLTGHRDAIDSLAWSPDAQMLASGSDDNTIRIWDVATDTKIRTLRSHWDNVLSVTWSPDGQMLASGSVDHQVILWDIKTARPSHVFTEHTDSVNCVAWSPDGRILASASGDTTICLWDIQSHALLQLLKGGNAWISSITWSPDSRILAAGAGSGSIDVWDVESGRQLAILQGHTTKVLCVAFSYDGRLLVSKSADDTVRFWRSDTWVGLNPPMEEHGEYLSGLAYHPGEHALATRDDGDNVIRIWDLDIDYLLHDSPAVPSVYYTNAKAVLIGEGGTGKSCLARALMGEPFEAQPATHGMQVWPFSVEVVARPGGGESTREILLWDLAGQTDYRIVHQLFLDETALGIVLFDPSHPDNPFSGVGTWEKSLRRVAGEDCPRLLVAGRVDRGYPAALEADIEEFLREHGFAEYIATSALTGEGIDRLHDAIKRAVPWESLGETTSPELWERMREFLLEQRASDVVLPSRSVLREAFRKRHPQATFEDAEFDTVIRLARAQGLVWPLSIIDSVLLKPELLDIYASAIVMAARNHPRGLGSVSEQDVLQAQIDLQFIEDRVDAATERLLLHAAVELFLQRQIAQRQVAGSDGQQLVFPSKFHQRLPDYREPPRHELVYRFVGQVEDIYATLVVRLFYGEAFELKNLWKDAAEFNDGVGHMCGFQLTNSDEGHGEISIFFEDSASEESKLLFVKFIYEHLRKHALNGSLSYERIYRCHQCGNEVRDREAVAYRLERGIETISCSYCDSDINLRDRMEEKFGEPRLAQKVQELDREADRKTDDAVLKTGEYDVYLAHNTLDIDQVRTLNMELRSRGLNPWFDKEQLRAGDSVPAAIEAAMTRVKSVAIIIGTHGWGRWQIIELETSLGLQADGRTRVIPVLLPGVGQFPPDRPMLGTLKYVKFDHGADEAAPLDELEQGIRGNYTEVSNS